MIPSTLALAAAAGVLVGLSLGTLGGGGSILTVPLLVYLLGQSPHAATTGSLLLVGVTALAGALIHLRGGRVRVGAGVLFAAVGVPGSMVGSRLSARVDGHVLLAGFAVLMLVSAVAMLMRSRRAGRRDHREPPAGPDDPGHPGPRRSVASPLLVAATATGVGLLTGFFGVGGGFLVVPALVLALAMPMPEAVGTSLLVIALNSGVALAIRLGGNPSFDWPVLIGFATTACLGALLGGRLVGTVRPERLNVAFAVLLVAVAGYTGVQSLLAFR